MDSAKLSNKKRMRNKQKKRMNNKLKDKKHHINNPKPK